VVVVVVAAGRL